MEQIIRALLKSKIIYSFETIYHHGLVSGITTLSIFLLRRPENLLLAGLVKYLVLKNYFCLYKQICFSFFTNGTCKFSEDKQYYTWKDNNSLKSSPSNLNYQGQCLAGQKYLWFQWNFSWYLLNRILSLSCKWEWYYSSLSGKSPNTE